jgi:hypothetical protein
VKGLGRIGSAQLFGTSKRTGELRLSAIAVTDPKSNRFEPARSPMKVSFKKKPLHLSGNSG